MQTPIVVTQNFTKWEFLRTFKQVGICIFTNSTLEYTKWHSNPDKTVKVPLIFHCKVLCDTNNISQVFTQVNTLR